jgi:hypothetical protein
VGGFDVGQRGSSLCGETGLGMRRHQHRSGSPVEVVGQPLGEGGDSLVIAQRAVALGGWRQTEGHEVRQHISPLGPNSLNQTGELRSALLDH